jgi:DNA-binding beta-propeller fold protein YncE
VDFIPVTFGSPQSAAVSSDGSVLAVATSHGLEVVDLATKRSIGRAIGGVLNIIHHPTRPLLYATGGTGVLELDDSSLERTRTFAGDAWAHTVSADGTRLYIVGLDGGTSIWNLETGVQERGNQVQGDGVAVTPDGRFLYVLYSYPAESRVFIVDRASGALLREVVLGGLAQRIAMSGEGIALISSGGDAGSTGWVDFLR